MAVARATAAELLGACLKSQHHPAFGRDRPQKPRQTAAVCHVFCGGPVPAYGRAAYGRKPFAKQGKPIRAATPAPLRLFGIRGPGVAGPCFF